MSGKVRYGIVGAGVIADWHARALRAAANSELAAVYDKNPQNAEKLAEKYGAKVYGDYKEFLESGDIDAVSIAVPSGSHMETALPAARAGKHILCEKPLEISLEKAEAVIEACRKNNVLLSVIFQLRFNETVQKIRRALDAGALGRIVLVSMRMRWFRTQEYYDSAGWRGSRAGSGGGALMTQAVHDLDLMLWLKGFPAEVTGYTSIMTHTGIEVEDNAAAVVRWPDGALGCIEASTSCAPGFPRALEISGEKGSVTLENAETARWKFAGPAVRKDAEEDITSGGGPGAGHNPADIGVDGHRRQFENLSSAILTGEKLFLSGEDGLSSLRFVNGIYESARSGKPVRF